MPSNAVGCPRASGRIRFFVLGSSRLADAIVRANAATRRPNGEECAMSTWKSRGAALATAFTLSATTAAAQPATEPIAEFYKGKQLTVLVRTTVGGGYDTLSRLVARHISKHVPGSPATVVMNMPGGGGIQAANHMGARAPQDGTWISIIGQGIPIDQSLGLNKSLQTDLRKLNWIANLGGSNQVMAVWHTSPTKNLADARKRETLIGTSGTGSISVQLPSIYNSVLGTKLKLVIGYPGGAEIDLAMERGEVEGRGTNPWSDYKAVSPRLVREKLINIIVQVGLQKEPDLPHAALLHEEATTPEGRAIAQFMTKAVAVGRPLATAPNVPMERVTALRKAVAAMVRDTEFLADAARTNSEVRYQSGEDLGKMITDVIDAPTELREKVKLAMEPPKDSRTVDKKAP
jgi:tripartite-type tricarboxylate transporter receptor subunit TctC